MEGLYRGEGLAAIRRELRDLYIERPDESEQKIRSLSSMLYTVHDRQR